MYKNNEYRPNINIDLDNGIYVFESESATGKTYLCKHLKKLRAYGEPVASFTYNDILLGNSIESVFKNCKLVVLDRYDLYKEVGHDLMRMYKDKAIILIDCKLGFIEGIDSETCFIDLTKNNIEVSL